MERRLTAQIPVLIAIRTVVNTAIRMVYPFLGHFSRGLGVDLWRLSFALTLRSASGMVGPFLASVADTRGRKAGMLLGLALFTAGAALVIAWPSYPAFVLTLILTIVGNFVFIPSLQAYLGDRIPYQRRGLVLALTEFGWSLSFILGVPLMGYLIGRYGWKTPFPLLTGLGALALVALYILLPKDPPPAAERPGLVQNIRRILAHPPALAGIAFGISLSASNELVNLIFGVWMEDAFGVKISALAAASAVIGFSELGGEALVTGLVDRLGKRRAVGAGLLLNSLAAFALFVLGRNVTGALAGLFLFYITFEFTLVSSIPLMTEVLPSVRATLMALFIAGLSGGRALGALFAPHLYAAGKLLTGAPNILFSVLVAVLVDLVALLFLRLVREEQEIEDKG